MYYNHKTQENLHDLVRIITIGKYHLPLERKFIRENPLMVSSELPLILLILLQIRSDFATDFATDGILQI